MHSLHQNVHQNCNASIITASESLKKSSNFRYLEVKAMRTTLTFIQPEQLFKYQPTVYEKHII